MVKITLFLPPLPPLRVRRCPTPRFVLYRLAHPVAAIKPLHPRVDTLKRLPQFVLTLKAMATPKVPAHLKRAAGRRPLKSTQKPLRQMTPDERRAYETERKRLQRALKRAKAYRPPRCNKKVSGGRCSQRAQQARLPAAPRRLPEDRAHPATGRAPSTKASSADRR